jgi:hypothetical protein
LAAIVLALIGSPAPPADANQSPAVTLRQLLVAGNDERLVITLTADGPISGRLEHVQGSPARFFIDLQNALSRVEAVTPVNRAGVVRIRVALNEANPPVTRVVFDVSRDVSSRVERGATERELRVIVGAEDGSDATNGDVVWCGEIADRLAALLEAPAPITSQPAQLAEETAWADLERELAGKTVSGQLQSIHFMLLQSARLGRIAAANRRVREPEQAAAGQAGARLLLDTARARLAEFPAKK